MTNKSSVPEGLHMVTPYIVSDDAPAFIAFIRKVFDASEVMLAKDDEGRIRHSEYRIGDSVVMVAQAYDQWKAKPAAFYVYVPDVDHIYEKALKAGAASTMAPEDKPYGDRSAGVVDPTGVDWWIGTRLE